MEIKSLISLLLLAPVAAIATGATVSLASYDFNDGFQGWTPRDNGAFSWVTMNLAEISADRGFANIDPADSGSLFMDVPQMKEARTHADITSPEIYISENALLSFYVGYSNYWNDDLCRLHLQISADDFKTFEVIWNSGWDVIRSWQWSKIEIPLESFAGEDVKFRFLYTTGYMDLRDDPGGYSGDFAIDNFIVSCEKEDPKKDDDDPMVTPDLSPKAVIGYPSDCFSSLTGNPVVPPHTPITFTDRSERNPETVSWIFTGLGSSPHLETTMRESNPTVSYPACGTFPMSLVAQNEHGISLAEGAVDVSYEADITNIPLKSVRGNIDLNGQMFPGSNTQEITAFGERFPAPAGVALIAGATLEFTRVSLADRLDGLSSIGVHLYSMRNGMPNIRLASSYIMASRLPAIEEGQDYEKVFFPFEQPVMISEDFIIVVDGIPALNGGTCVAFSLAELEETEPNSLLRKGGEWIEAKEITSIPVAFGIFPFMEFSVFFFDEDQETEFKVNGKSGEISFSVFSYLEINPESTDSDWLNFTERRIDGYDRMAVISYEALPEGLAYREGTITFGDGNKSVTIRIIQDKSAGVEAIDFESDVTLIGIDGSILFEGKANCIPELPDGIYILRQGSKTLKIIR